MRRCSVSGSDSGNGSMTGRDELRQHAAYLLALDEWLTAGRDPDYLLAGGRLDQFEQWRATTTMRLTETEREFLDEALRRRDQARGAEAARVAAANQVASPGTAQSVRPRRHRGRDRDRGDRRHRHGGRDGQRRPDCDGLLSRFAGPTR